MSIHTVIFTLFTIVTIADRVNDDIYTHKYTSNLTIGTHCLDSYDCMVAICPCLPWFYFLRFADYTMILAMIILMIYMSVKFSQPLDRMW